MLGNLRKLAFACLTSFPTPFSWFLGGSPRQFCDIANLGGPPPKAQGSPASADPGPGAPGPPSKDLLSSLALEGPWTHLS